MGSRQVELATRPPAASPATAPPAWIEAVGFELVEAKLRPPEARGGLVTRTALVDRLAAVEAPVTAVVAPAGYGKTTVLAQSYERSGPRAVWVTAEGLGNDPLVIVTYVAVALARIEALGPEVVDALVARRPVHTILNRLLSWLSQIEEPLSLMVDQVDSLTNPEAADVLVRLALGMPFAHRLAVASRGVLSWPAPRMRVEGRLHEVGVDDLTLAPTESAALLAGSGVELDASTVDELTRRTEGWAAGLYLAALAMQAGAPGDQLAAIPRGSHPFLGDYMRTELLDRLSDGEVRFLTRTSVLDQLSAPLCDAVLDSTGSAAWLERIESQNLFLQRLDQQGQWFRFHRVFRELLLGELRRREPDLVPDLHRRAAAWCGAHDMREVALEHAQAAGEGERAVALLHDLMQPTWASGRADTVMRWLEWLEQEDLLALHPPLAVHGSLLYALAGRPIEAERWADAVLASSAEGGSPDGSSMGSLLAYLRAFLCRDGVDEMQVDAQISYAGLSPGSPYRSSMLFVDGTAHRLRGSPDEADAVLAHAFDAAMAIEGAPNAALVLVERSGIAAERRDWAEATRMADHALELVGDGTFDEYWSSAVVFAWGARVAMHRGDVPTARGLLARASRLRPLLTYALPVTSVRSLLEMARAYLALDDQAGATAVTRQARDILVQRPDLGALGAELEDLQAQIARSASTAVGATSLTAAELRLLPYLSSRLTLQDIADRLYLSRNTVKSQAVSVYRKLGVSSRGAAIERLQECGLLVA